MLDEIPDGFYLEEYVHALKKAFELAMPTYLRESESDKSGKNLHELY